MCSKKSLYISGGIYSGKKILCPPGEIRPAMAIMRKTLFQVLTNMYYTANNNKDINAEQACEGMSVADLFSGSALMALECMSRGAKQVTAVESDFQKWNVISQNAKKILGTTQMEKFFLYRDKVERFLLKHTKSFDMIYCDPPFLYKYKNDLLKKIAKSKTLHKKSTVIIHIPKQENLLEEYSTEHNTLIKQGVRQVGSSTLYFYKPFNKTQ